MSEYTSTYILTWNPNKFDWREYEEMVGIVKDGIGLETDWSCRSKNLRKGDRFILLMQGMGIKNGVVGFGKILTSTYELPFTEFGDKFVDIRFERMWNYKTDKYVRTDVLKSMFPEQCFVPQFSGIKVKSSILPVLWRVIDDRNSDNSI